MLKNNIKRIDIANNLSIKTGFSKNYSKKLIYDLIEIIIDNIKSNNLIIKNFGTFKTIHKKQRLGRNPKTKEEYIIASRKSVHFVPSKILIDKLNKYI